MSVFQLVTGTYSDSNEATGHLYCAVENKQMSANCRTEKDKTQIQLRNYFIQNEWDTTA